MTSLKTLFPCLALVFMLFPLSGAREFLVDGKGSSWKVPSSPDDYNKWAAKNRFKIGDYLVMEYDANTDSVLEVVEADYNSCNKGNPIKAYHDGKTKIQLDRSGPFYFISGAEDHCEKGEKLVVKVLSAKHGARSPPPAPAPAPSLAPSSVGYYAPAPAPVNAGSGLKLESTLSWIALFVGGLVGFALV